MGSMIAIFYVLYHVQTSRNGIIVEDSFLRLRQEGAVQKFQGDCYGEPTVITVEGRFKIDKTVKITVVMGDKIKENYELQISNPNSVGYCKVNIKQHGKDVYVGSYILGDHFLSDKNGNFYLEDIVTTTVNGLPNWNVIKVSYQQLVQIVTGDAIIHRGQWFIYWTITLALMPIYLVDLIFPKFFFYLKYALSVNNPEPSDFYIEMQRFGWFVMPLLLGIGYLVGLFK